MGEEGCNGIEFFGIDGSCFRDNVIGKQVIFNVVDAPGISFLGFLEECLARERARQRFKDQGKIYEVIFQETHDDTPRITAVFARLSSSFKSLNVTSFNLTLSLRLIKRFMLVSTELRELAEIFKDLLAEYPQIVQRYFLDMLSDFPTPAPIKHRGKIMRHDDREWDKYGREGKLLPTNDNVRVVTERNESITDYDVDIIVKYQIQAADLKILIVDPFVSDESPTITRLTMLLRRFAVQMLEYYRIAEFQRAREARDEQKLREIEKGLKRVGIKDAGAWMYLKLEDFYRIEDVSIKKNAIIAFEKADYEHAKETGFDRVAFIDERDFELSKKNPEIKRKLASGEVMGAKESEILKEINDRLEHKHTDPETGKIGKTIGKRAEKLALNLLKKLSQYSVRTVPKASSRGESRGG